MRSFHLSDCIIRAVLRQILGWLIWPQVMVGEAIHRRRGRRPQEQPFDLSQLKRVLLLRLDQIGDVIMTGPLLRELRRLLPEAEITLVVKPSVLNLVRHCPYVTEVLTFDWTSIPFLWPLERHWKAVKCARQQFYPRRFDLAIVPRWDVDIYHASFLAYFSGAPWRLGYSEKVSEDRRRLNMGYDRLINLIMNDDRLKHEVEHNLDVIRFLGGTVKDDRLELWLAQEDREFAQRALKTYGLRDNELLIGVGPGAGDAKRRWPLSNFAELVAWLNEELNGRVIVLGGPDEKPLGDQMEQECGQRVINLVGRTTLRQMGAVLRRCRLYVGNDAGPMHLAAAAGVPVIELSCHPRNGSPTHLNSPTRFHPWGVPYRVLQPEKGQDGCRDACLANEAHCIRQIAVEQVKQAIVEHLPKSGPSERIGEELRGFV